MTDAELEEQAVNDSFGKAREEVAAQKAFRDGFRKGLEIGRNGDGTCLPFATDAGLDFINKHRPESAPANVKLVNCTRVGQYGSIDKGGKVTVTTWAEESVPDDVTAGNTPVSRGPRWGWLDAGFVGEPPSSDPRNWVRD